MNKYINSHVADLRLAILEILAAAEGGEVPVGVIKSALAEATLHRPAAVNIRRHIAWLNERGLVMRQLIDGHIEGASITEKGDDVAQGRLQQVGIGRPKPSP